MRWQVPRAWPGATIAILASGPSMSAAVAAEVIGAGVPAIVVNSTFRLHPSAWALFAADPEWWEHPKNRDARAFAGLKVSVSSVPGVHRLHNSGLDGFDPDPGCVRSGGNSGYQALHLAVHAGAARVLLCGFDMEGGHWHGDHPAGLRGTTPETYAKWRERFASLVKPLAERGVEVLNCTPGSALTCFPFRSLEDALCPMSESC